MANLLAILANWVPDPSPEFGKDPSNFITLTVAGFVMGVLGHLFRSKVMVAIGVGTVFVGAFLFPLITYLSLKP